jgi:alkaline phosphatase D
MSALAFASALPARLLNAATDLSFSTDPFLLGVASGYPSSNGVILWTRLLTSLEEPHRDINESAIPVAWEVATDEKMRKVIRKGTEYATPEFAHSIHLELTGLKPEHDYWYRFTAGGKRSPIGRTRTAPAPQTKLRRLRVAVASCQKYENGYYNAYRHMLDDNLDLIVHVGDYIYEYASAVGGNNIRGDGTGETLTLDQYRARHALVKSDPDLRAAHSLCPWLVTWDDHEVANDYAGDWSYDLSGEEFLLRRAAAYRAYYEHMPLPRSALPIGPNMQLYANHRFGKLVQIQMLDSRQHRSPIACLGTEDNGGPGARCVTLFNAARTKLGKQQEEWMRSELTANHAQWNILAQGTPMAHVDMDPGDGVAYRRDSWDGYPAARQRFMDTLTETKATNPVVIDGDIHAFQVADLNRQANDVATPVIASELTTTSITSSGISQRQLDQRRAFNPNVLLSDSSKHGYLLLDINRERMRADLVTVDTIKQPDSARGLMASYVVENGKPGPVKA